MKHYIVLGSLLGVSILGKVLHSLYCRIKFKKVLFEEKKEEVVNEALFFPDKEYPCDISIKSLTKGQLNICYNQSCRRLHGRPNEPPSSMLRFLEYLSNAKTNVDLCIYIFTQPILANILSDLHKRGIKIRIITDGSWDATTLSRLDLLHNSGVKIKYNRHGTGALMHHKFLIIDDSFLLTGSFNWTSKAVTSNYEAVIITSNQRLVRSFSKKFDEMWSRFPDYYIIKRNF